MLKTLLILFCFLISKALFGQIHYYSDCFNGGAVGDGYTAWYQGGISTVQLPIPEGSTIKKAFFFSNLYKWEGNNIPAVDKTIDINGVPLILSESYSLDNTFYMQSNQDYLTTIAIDITSYIDPFNSIYFINPMNSGVQTIPFEPLFSDFYILVFFENQAFNTSCIDVYVNEFNTGPNFTYNLTSSNPINELSEVGIAVHASAICNNPNDWYEVLINSTSLGNIGGQEDNTSVYCAGVIGSFIYANGTLTGIGNDNSDTPMNGLDAISNIQPIINGNESFNVTFDYVSNLSPNSNVINQLFLTYTSNCDTFSVTTPNDTTICQGETLQLNVSGGQTYEWLPTTGLSCTDCPNPIFSGDSSLFYTVRIWNNDSCAVVRPLKINVRPKPEFGAITTQPSECGTNNGSVVLLSANDTQEPISYTLNGGPSEPSGIFSSLGSGANTFQLQDGFACFSEDTIVLVSEINNTIASFSVSPNYGTAPLTVQTNNTSQNATDYWWSINEIDQGNNLSSFSFNTSGNYTIELIAWQYDPSCADTSIQTVSVIDKLLIPTAFTPDNDGINETWELPFIDEFYPNSCVRIYNRWGEILFRSDQGKYAIHPWNGKFKDEYLPTGSYYFIIETNDQNKQIFKGTVSILR